MDRSRVILEAPVKLTFGIPDWPHSGGISAEELVKRLQCRFPTMLVDREKGNAFVQQRLDQLIALGAPEVILNSHRRYFDNTIYASISPPDWQGVSATSYVHSIRMPALEGVDFDVTDATDETTRDNIARELAGALGMALCSEINWETGGRLSGNG